LIELFALSRQYCITICSVLVPINLLLSSLTLLLLVRPFPKINIGWNAGLAITAALAMVFHVSTWLAVGVVMAPTYILLSLALICLTINGGAIALTQLKIHPKFQTMTAKDHLEPTLRWFDKLDWLTNPTKK